jgi:phosphatidylserine synthase 2
MMKLFHPSLGEPLPEMSYGDNCEFYTPDQPEKWYVANFYDAIDVHVVAHFFGWWFKMMIIRDVKIAWICSIGFEFIELSFRYMLPNFIECWWDHLFLDLFGCNMIGIQLGAWTLKYAGVSRINWIYQKPKTKSNACADKSQFLNVINKFKPDVLTTYDWKTFASLKRYCAVIFYIFFISSVDALNFLMKFVLYVPHTSDVLKGRVAIWGFTAIITSKEFFEYLDDPNCKRVGPFYWLSVYTLAIEYGIWFKFSQDI